METLAQLGPVRLAPLDTDSRQNKSSGIRDETKKLDKFAMIRTIKVVNIQTDLFLKIQ